MLPLISLWLAGCDSAATSPMEDGRVPPPVLRVSALDEPIVPRAEGTDDAQLLSFANQLVRVEDPQQVFSLAHEACKAWRDDSRQRDYLEAIFGEWLPVQANQVSRIRPFEESDCVTAAESLEFEVRPTFMLVLHEPPPQSAVRFAKHGIWLLAKDGNHWAVVLPRVTEQSLTLGNPVARVAVPADAKDNAQELTRRASEIARSLDVATRERVLSAMADDNRALAAFLLRQATDQPLPLVEHVLDALQGDAAVIDAHLHRRSCFWSIGRKLYFFFVS